MLKLLPALDTGDPVGREDIPALVFSSELSIFPPNHPEQQKMEPEASAELWREADDNREV